MSSMSVNDPIAFMEESCGRLIAVIQLHFPLAIQNDHKLT